MYYRAMRTREKPTIRKNQLLDAAITLASRVGYGRITRDGVALEAKVSFSLVTRYFSTIAQLKRAVMRAAINRGVTEIVAQGLGMQDPAALKAPEAIRKKALEFMTS